MTFVLLVQLPIPRHTFGRRTGNVPLGAACLQQAARGVPGLRVTLLDPGAASRLGDAALLTEIVRRRPDAVGFTVFSWNIDRSLYFAAKLKEACGPRIILGGPEVTADNDRARSPDVDFRVFGDGEAVFRRLWEEPGLWAQGSAAESADALFRAARSPYLEGLIDPAGENLMLLETQRGCPYRCGFCFYHKARRGLAPAAEEHLLAAVAWAVDRGVPEIYLLDPSLNARPRLKPLLKAIARLNAQRRVRLFSEIRAEAVDADLAGRLAAAGFDWFEIGLQSTNPAALRRMNRPTDLRRFAAGARRLKARGITPSIDLILGLPGDDLRGFMRSVDFVVENGLQDDVQVFPLAVLPGTAFRRRSRALGLRHEPHPPYTVLETGTFRPEEFLLAYDYAESRLDTVFFPLPDLDLAFRSGRSRGLERAADVEVRVGGELFVAKLIIARERPLAEIRRLAGRLTHPYQLLVGPQASNPAYLRAVLSIVTAENPFTPLEVVFFEPAEPPRTAALLEAARIRRPHYLDGDLRFLCARPGNRAVLFTLVSAHPAPRFQGDMERQVFWWKSPALPQPEELEAFAGLDGVLIDSAASSAAVADWQARFGARAAEQFHLSFAGVAAQRHWLAATQPEEYGAFFGAGANRRPGWR
jgi:hypothetical protein